MQKFKISLLLCAFMFGITAADAKVDREALIIVLSSPSGGGKTSIAEKLLKLDHDLTTAISVTTRAARPGEVDGRDYHYMDLKKFQELEKQKAFLQTAHVFGNYYGTLRKEIDALLAQGKDVLFTVDWQASRSLTKEYPKNIIRIFVLPPNLAILQQRLSARGQDSVDVIKVRMDQALNEISHWNEYDYVIVNTELDHSVSQVHAILQSERLKRTRQVGLQKFIDALAGEVKK